MIRDAVFSEDGKKRLVLIRDWSVKEPRTLNLIGLNPSKAGYTQDDPTIRKGIGFATRWGYNCLVMTNLNPVVSTDPWALPPWSGFDQENLGYLRWWLERADLVVAAWGSVPEAISRIIAWPEYVHWLRNAADSAGRDLYCIGETAKGGPRHPSRAPYTTAPVLYHEADVQSVA